MMINYYVPLALFLIYKNDLQNLNYLMELLYINILTNHPILLVLYQQVLNVYNDQHIQPILHSIYNQQNNLHNMYFHEYLNLLLLMVQHDHHDINYFY